MQMWCYMYVWELLLIKCWLMLLHMDRASITSGNRLINFQKWYGDEQKTIYRCFGFEKAGLLQYDLDSKINHH
jgi:hypothetical protein